MKAAQQHVADHMQSIFTNFGLPEQIVSDKGLSYTDKNFQDMCKRHDIHHLISTLHHHQSNGKAEKYVGIVKRLMTKAHETWQSIPMALLIYRNIWLPATIDIPMQLLDKAKGNHIKTYPWVA